MIFPAVGFGVPFPAVELKADTVFPPAAVSPEKLV